MPRCMDSWFEVLFGLSVVGCALARLLMGLLVGLLMGVLIGTLMGAKRLSRANVAGCVLDGLCFVGVCLVA